MANTNTTTAKTIKLKTPRAAKSGGGVYTHQTGPFDNGGAANSWGYERLAQYWTVIQSRKSGKFYVLTSN